MSIIFENFFFEWNRNIKNYKEGDPLPAMSPTLPVHIRTNLFHNRSRASHFILFSIRQIEEIKICVRWTGWVHQIVVTICAVFISDRLEDRNECKIFFRISKSIGWIFFILITTRKGSLGQGNVLHLCVILFTGGRGWASQHALGRGKSGRYASY